MVGAKRLHLILIMLLVVIFITQNSHVYSTGEELEITIEDALHRTIVLNRIPQRVVSIAPGITETMFSLGLEYTLVGVDDVSYNDTCLGISEYLKKKGVEHVGGYWWSAISIEKILALKPDLVLADAGAHKPLLNIFEENNITVVFLHGGSANSINDIYSDIMTIGRIFNIDTAKVLELINNIENNITKARSMIKSENLSILVIVGFYNGIWVAGKATFIDDLLSRLSLNNVANVIGWKAVNIETIRSWNPDIVIVANMGFIDEKMLKETGLYDLETPLVLLSPNETNLLVRPGPFVGLGALLLARKIANFTQIIPSQMELTDGGTVTVTKTETVTSTKTKIVEKVEPAYDQAYMLVAIIIVLATIVLFNIISKK